MCPLIEFSRRAAEKMPQHEIVHESLNNADGFSQPAQANTALQQLLHDRESVLESIPSVPPILRSLLGALEQPPDRVDMGDGTDDCGCRLLRRCWIPIPLQINLCQFVSRRLPT